MSTKTISGTRNGKMVTKTLEVLESDHTWYFRKLFGTTGYWTPGSDVIKTYRGKTLLENVKVEA